MSAEEIVQGILTEEELKHKQSEALSTAEDHVSGASRGTSPVVILQSVEGADTIPAPAQLIGKQKESHPWTLVKGRGKREREGNQPPSRVSSGRSNLMQKHQLPRNQVPCQGSKKQTRQENILCEEVRKLLLKQGRIATVSNRKRERRRRRLSDVGD